MAEQPGRTVVEVARLLSASGRSLAIAESLTGGELSAKFACAPDAGDWFRGGLVAYSSDVKRAVLGVPSGPVVSEDAVRAMATGIAALLDADITVAVTGVAGPDSQDGQPPGTVWLAIHDRGSTQSKLEHLVGEPDEIVDATSTCAIEWLRQTLSA